MKKVILLAIATIFLISVINARELSCSYDNPLALWHFDEGNGTTTSDSCHNYTSTILGSEPNWTVGKYYHSIYFNGVDNYLNFGNILSQSFTNLSIALWIKPVAHGDKYQTYISRGEYYTDERINVAQDTFEFYNYVILGASNSNVGVANDNSTDGNWHFVVMTYNGSAQNLSGYYDGAYSGSQTVINPEILTSTKELWMGTDYYDPNYLEGSMDEVAIFDRVLSEPEILNMYQDFNCSYPINVLSVPSYPYADLSADYTITIYQFPLNYFDIKMDVDNQTFLFNYLTEIGGYQLTLNFTEEGDFPFVIYGDLTCPFLENLTGTIKVRKPYYLTFDFYKSKSSNNSILDYIFSGRYKNEFAYVTAEFSSYSINNPTASNVEKYLVPMTYKSQYKKSVFHAPYTDGESVLKLWEKNQNYNIRLVDGIINFEGVYSVPNVTESYGTNVFVGQFYLNGSSQSYSIYLSQNDLHPYRILWNIALAISLVFLFIVIVILSFAIPRLSIALMIFGFLISFGLIFLRVLIWWWSGS